MAISGVCSIWRKKGLGDLNDDYAYIMVRCREDRDKFIGVV